MRGALRIQSREALRHLVRLLRDLANLVVTDDCNWFIEIPFAKAAQSRGELCERAQHGAAESQRQHEDCEQTGNANVEPGLSRGGVGPVHCQERLRELPLVERRGLFE